MAFTMTASTLMWIFQMACIISKAYADKFLLKPGDSITLKEKYEDDEYTFKISWNL